MEGNPPDAGSVGKAIEYLEACRQLFERGILCHAKIENNQSPVLQNMSDGYTFFVGWADYAWEQGIKLIKSKVNTVYVELFSLLVTDVTFLCVCLV